MVQIEQIYVMKMDYEAEKWTTVFNDLREIEPNSDMTKVNTQSISIAIKQANIEMH